MIRLKRLLEQGESDSDAVLNRYLSSKPELIPLYKEIEQVLGDKFTEDHFEQEIQISGGLKNEAGGLLTKVVQQFSKMLKANGLSSTIKPNSYRDYKKQKETFLKYATGSIRNGLRQAALPGYSQHHTGKALDISNSNMITDKMLSAYGFSRPYAKDKGFRMVEPWHIFYTG